MNRWAAKRWLFYPLVLFLAIPGFAMASSMEWAQIGQPLTPRAGSGICYNSNKNSIYLFGGSSGYGSDYNDVWEWNASRWNLLSSEHKPDDMWGTGSLLYQSSEDRILLIGCQFSDNLFQIWEWIDDDWLLINESNSLLSEWRYFVSRHTSR